MHRFNLAKMFLQRKTNDMLPEPNVKRSTLSALDPGFLGGTGEEKRNKVRSLDRHLEQGNTFQSMWLRSAGLCDCCGPRDQAGKRPGKEQNPCHK